MIKTAVVKIGKTPCQDTGALSECEVDGEPLTKKAAKERKREKKIKHINTKKL